MGETLRLPPATGVTSPMSSPTSWLSEALGEVVCNEPAGVWLDRQARLRVGGPDQSV